MVSKVMVMQGVSGSGKSTIAAKFAIENDGFVVSADDFFLNDEGVYTFNPTLLSRAHGSCFYKFLDYLNWGSNVIVDNTNTTGMEIAPYATAVAAFNHKNDNSPEYHFEIVSVERDLDTCIKSNKHGVPEKAIRAQADRIKHFSSHGNPFKWTVRRYINEELS